MSSETIEYVRLFANVSFAIPLVVYVARFNRSPTQNHIIGLLIVISGSIDILTYFKIVTAPILHNLFTVLEFILLSFFYYCLVFRKRGEMVLLISIGIFISAMLFCFQTYNESENYMTLWSLRLIICMVYGLVYVLSIQNLVLDRYFDANLLSNMIFNGALIFYAIVSLPMFLTSTSILHQYGVETVKVLWAFHNISLIIMNFGLACGFYYTGKREIYMTLEQLEKIARKLEEEGQQPD